MVTSLGLLISFFGVQKFIFQKALVFDGLSFWASLIILFVTFLTLIFALESPSVALKRFPEFVFLTLNSALGMAIVIWSNDLIITFIGIEMTSLCLYVLIALSLEKKLSKEAAFKYFVLSSFASAFFLYGISFIYGSAETTYLSEISPLILELMTTNRLFLVGVGLVAMGLCFKVALFPFHAWAPDVYQGAPTPITGFMATGLKASVFIAFLRWVGTGFLETERSENFIEILHWCAVLTMLAGNIAALLQNNLKRMLAYSSISHSGFILIGLIAAGVGEEKIWGASSLLYYVSAYSLMTVGLFGVLCLFEKKAGSQINISDLRGLSSNHLWLALCLTFFLASLAGLPPTIGFFAKLLVLYAAVKQGFFWLAIWAVISTLIGVYYYLRPVILMYRSQEEEDTYKIQREGEGERKNKQVKESLLKQKKGALSKSLSSREFLSGGGLKKALPSRNLTYFWVTLSALLTLFMGLAIEPIYKAMAESLLSLFS